MKKTLTTVRTNTRTRAYSVIAALVLSLVASGCGKRQDKDKNILETAEDKSSRQALETSVLDSYPSLQKPETHAGDCRPIQRFVANSPFDVEYASPISKEGKLLWARSCLWEKAPDFVVEKWITEKPDIEGKYVLLKFWGTRCSQCKRAAPKLNDFHKKFGNEMVIIGISDETEQIVRNFIEPKIEYYIAIDIQARMKNELGVFGIPHVIIIEPGGYVVWEGFPFLNGYELTEEVVEKILDVGTKQHTGNSTSLPRPSERAPGRMKLLYNDPDTADFEPRPIMPRPRPIVLTESPFARNRSYTAEPFCNSAKISRHKRVSSRGKLVRVIEGRPVVSRHQTQQNNPTNRWKNHGGTHARVLGTIPLAVDGSFFVEVPADRLLHLQVLDSDRRVLGNQIFWMYARPGETRSCVGCHEARDNTTLPNHFALAVKKPPVECLPTGGEFSYLAKAWLKGIIPDECEERTRTVRAINLIGRY